MEDEQDQGEDRQNEPLGPPHPEAEGSEGSPWWSGGGGGVTTEEEERDQGQWDPWRTPGPGEVPSFRVDGPTSTLLALRSGSQDCTTDSDDGGVQYRQEYLNTEKRDRAGLLYTPDTDAPNTSDADVPPSYSKVGCLDPLLFCAGFLSKFLPYMEFCLCFPLLLRLLFGVGLGPGLL